IHFQRLLLFPTHQVDIELRDAGVDQSTQLFAMSFDRSDNAETINDFIRHKIGIAAFDLAVMLVVVAGAVLHVRSERGRQVFWLVLTDEIHDVVENNGGNQRTLSPGTSKSVENQNGPAANISIPRQSPPRTRAP